MISIALNNDYDIKIGPSGIMLEETTNQDIAIVLECHQGEIKEDPKLGVGIDDLTNDEDVDYWNASIRDNLKRLGMNVNTAQVSGNKLDIIAEYV